MYSSSIILADRKGIDAVEFPYVDKIKMKSDLVNQEHYQTPSYSLSTMIITLIL
jgi:hypothetical protein